MDASDLTINDQVVGLNEVWAHLNSSPNIASDYFCLRVKGESIVDVFDEGGSKPKHLAWNDFIAKKLQELGNAALDFYLRKLRTIDQVPYVPVKWVIVSIEKISLSP